MAYHTNCHGLKTPPVGGMGHGRTGRERGKGLKELFTGTNSQASKGEERGMLPLIRH